MWWAAEERLLRYSGTKEETNRKLPRYDDERERLLRYSGTKKEVSIKKSARCALF